MGEIKLKPCRVCGGKAQVYKLKNGKYYIDCSLISGFRQTIPNVCIYATKEKAVEEWNRREGERDEQP